MKRKSKPATIVDAFIDTRTDASLQNAAWYSTRLEICSACDRNSKNCSTLNSRIVDRLENMFHLNKAFCRECGCLIRQKCAAREEACALEKSGAARWPRLAVLTAAADDFDLENLSPESCNIDLSANSMAFTVNCGRITPRPETHEIRLALHAKNGLRIRRVFGSCSCLTAKHAYITESDLEITVLTDLQQIPAGTFSKSVWTVYVRENREKTLEIQLTGEILNPLFP
jgi:hypothetical protein